MKTQDVGASRDGGSNGDRARPRERSALTGMPVEQLESEIVGLTRRLNANTYELLVLVGELDANGKWARTGALSCAAWLSQRCDIEMSSARSQVRVARAMQTYPQLDVAIAQGDISYAKARVLVASLSAENVEDLIHIAITTPADLLTTAIATWLNRHESEDEARKRQSKARGVRWRTEPDGMIVITARLTPAVGGAVCAVIDSGTKVMNAPAGATLAQQRADSLAHTMTHGGGVCAEVVVHVTEEGNRLNDGTPISDHALGEFLSDAFVSLLIHDNKRNPIDASPRRRSPTRRQKRVVDEKYPQCHHPGCNARDFLEYDHINPYAQGGDTVLENLQRLCDPHNRAKSKAAR